MSCISGRSALILRVRTVRSVQSIGRMRNRCHVARLLSNYFEQSCFRLYKRVTFCEFFVLFQPGRGAANSPQVIHLFSPVYDLNVVGLNGVVISGRHIIHLFHL